jgi:hypothetical protein
VAALAAPAPALPGLPELLAEAEAGADAPGPAAV